MPSSPFVIADNLTTFAFLSFISLRKIAWSKCNDTDGPDNGKYKFEALIGYVRDNDDGADVNWEMELSNEASMVSSQPPIS